MATAPTTVPAAGLPLPTPPSTSDPSNFDARGDAFFAALPALQTSENALAANVYTNAVGAYNNALEVAGNAASVSANAALVAAYANAPVWVTATVYAVDTVRYSPIDRRLYRCIVTTTVGDTTDPKNDTTKWAILSPAQAVLLVSALVQQAVSGSSYAFTNVTAQSAATNLLLYSSQFDNAAWGQSSMTVSANFTMSPAGETNADKLVEAAATAVHYTFQTLSIASNVPYAYSIAMKAAGRTVANLVISDDTFANNVAAIFNLNTGAITSVINAGTGSGATATSAYLGDGWWLCSISGIPKSTNVGTVRLFVMLNGYNQTYAGDGVSGVYVAQAQLETGTVYTSHIDTGAAQATRGSGVIAPSRIVFPANPAADAFVRVFVTNGIDTNVIDPNGSTIMGLNGPVKIDNPSPQSLGWQYVNGSWRLL